MDEEKEQELQELTVGDLRRELDGLSDDTKLLFAGELTFFRVKRQGDDVCIVEFNEPQAHLSDTFKEKNPNVKVAFIDSGNAEWGEAGLVSQSLDIEVR